MKILSPREVERQRKEAEEAHVHRAIDLALLLKEENQVLEEIRAKSVKEKAELENDFVRFSEDIGRKRSVLQSEVLELEERKRVALEPIQSLEAAAKEKLRNALQLEEKITAERGVLAHERRSLDDEARKIESEREHLAEWEKTVRAEQKTLVEDRARIEKEREDVGASSLAFSKQCEERESALRFAEREVERAKEEVRLGRELNDKESKENKKERLRLVDLQGTIRDALQELRNKNV